MVDGTTEPGEHQQPGSSRPDRDDPHEHQRRDDPDTTLLAGSLTTSGGVLLPKESFLNGSNNTRRSLSRLIPHCGRGDCPDERSALSRLLELLAGDIVSNLTFKTHTPARATPAPLVVRAL